MIFELLADMVKMGFIVFCLYAVFRGYMHGQQPARSMLLERRRLSVVSALVLVVLTLKVTEDVLGGESGPIDRAILVFVHGNVSTTLTAAFEYITLSVDRPLYWFQWSACPRWPSCAQSADMNPCCWSRRRWSAPGWSTS